MIHDYDTVVNVRTGHLFLSDDCGSGELCS
jgi:hypothetical protein